MAYSNSEDQRDGSNLSALRADVTETTNALKMTVEKLVQRGDNLDHMNARAQDLSSSSYYFRGTSRQLNRRMQWQSYRLTIFIGMILICYF